MSTPIYILSRAKGVIDFVRARLPRAVPAEGLTREEMAGGIIASAMPLWEVLQRVAAARVVYLVDLPRAVVDTKAGEWSAADLEDSGARLLAASGEKVAGSFRVVFRELKRPPEGAKYRRYTCCGVSPDGGEVTTNELARAVDLGWESLADGRRVVIWDGGDIILSFDAEGFPKRRRGSAYELRVVEGSGLLGQRLGWATHHRVARQAAARLSIKLPGWRVVAAGPQERFHEYADGELVAYRWGERRVSLARSWYEPPEPVVNVPAPDRCVAVERDAADMGEPVEAQHV